MIAAESHQEAADFVVGLLVGAPGVSAVHAPPVPTSPVAAPCVLVATPEGEPSSIAATGGLFRCQVLVVGGDTVGTGLVALVDSVCAALHAAGVRFATGRTTYNPPTSPAPLPAQLVTIE